MSVIFEVRAEGIRSDAELERERWSERVCTKKGIKETGCITHMWEKADNSVIFVSCLDLAP